MDRKSYISFLCKAGSLRGLIIALFALFSLNAQDFDFSDSSATVRDSRMAAIDSWNLAQNQIPQMPRAIPQNQNRQIPQSAAIPRQIPAQQPLIVEYKIFKAAEQACGAGQNIGQSAGQNAAKIDCLVRHLRAFNGRIHTKISGTKSRVAVIFYALDINAKITHPRGISNKTCEFFDTTARRSVSKLRGEGFIYVIEYPFSASSSHNNAYIACGFTQNGRTITHTTQPISVIPHSIDIDFAVRDATDALVSLNDADFLTLKAQNNALQIATNATARTIDGEIDRGFSENLVPLYINFRRDNGLCSALGEKITGAARFRNGQLFDNTLSMEFSDIASGELEIAFIHRLDAKDRRDGKCLVSAESSVDSNATSTQGADSSANVENLGKIPCQRPIVIKKRVEVLPHSFYAHIETQGRQLYYNQHTFAPALPYLPLMKIELTALNSHNQPLKNFTDACYGRDLSITLDDNVNNFVLINENMPDSIVPKGTFAGNSQSRIVRRFSSSGTKERNLTPVDLFISRALNLNDAFLRIDFVNMGEKYPRYMINPRYSNDWRIALLRGRIAIATNINDNASLVANPSILYEFYCKSPVCKVVDIESIISPNARFPKGSAANWFINTAHPRDLKVQENHIALANDALRVYSIGNVSNGVQTLAIQGANKGEFDIKIRQGLGADDFAQFLYFAPSYENIRENLGTDGKVRF